LAYQQQQRRLRSKSTDQLHQMRQQQRAAAAAQADSADERVRLDSGTLKRMLKPVARTAPDSPITSPEGGRGRQYQGHAKGAQQGRRANGYAPRPGQK